MNEKDLVQEALESIGTEKYAIGEVEGHDVFITLRYKERLRKWWIRVYFDVDENDPAKIESLNEPLRIESFKVYQKAKEMFDRLTAKYMDVTEE